MIANCWIQASDFNSVDLGHLDEEAAISAYKDHDWDTALRERDRLEELGVEFCDPGIGFVMEGGRILHICAVERNEAMSHYHYAETKRFLGLIPHQKQRVLTVTGLDTRVIPKLIRNFYRGEHHELLRRAT